jgi:hypothetical protein
LRLNLKGAEETPPTESELYQYFGFDFSPNRCSALLRYNELIKIIPVIQNGIIESLMHFEKGEFWLMFENLKQVERVGNLFPINPKPTPT